MESAKENPRVNLESPSNDVDASRDSQEDDSPLLSSQTLQALKEFLGEQNREIKPGDDAAEEVAFVAEDWRFSQFWYDRSIAETIATEVLTICRNLRSPSVACIACPTLKLILKCQQSFLSMTRGLSNMGLSSRFMIITSLRIFHCH